jgi:Tubulin like
VLKPMLFIGCGGSGLRTLRRLRRELEFRLASVGVGREEFPDAWQFLVIDVPADEMLSDAELKSYAGTSYVGLADQENGYLFENGIDDQLSRREHSRKDFVQWRPDPSKTPVDVSKGAGQWRAVGRVVAGYSLSAKVGERVSAATNAMSSDTSDASLRHVAAQLGIAGADTEAIDAPMAFIVSSLGGGAGSGIFMDVADLLRRMSGGDPWLQRSVGILFEPSVFYTQDKFNRSGISPNTLAAISELTAGRWAPWDSFPYMVASSHPGSNRGPEYPMLFGTDNGQINLGSGDAAYEMAAYILSNLALSGQAGNALSEWLQANWGSKSSSASTAAPNVHDTGLTASNRPLSSLGFARVTLGRDRFARYAAQRMTKGIIQHIMTAHEDDDVTAGRKTVEQRIKELTARDSANDLVSQFLSECGLNEASRSNNQVLDALLDQSKVDEAAAALQSYVVERVNDPRAILDQFKQAMRSSSQTVTVDGNLQIPQIHAGILEAVGPWVELTQRRVMDTIVRWVATQGLRVTVEVVRQAAEQDLARVVPEELRAEAVVDSKEGKGLQAGFIEAVGGAVAKLKKGQFPQTLKDMMKKFIVGQVNSIAQEDVRQVAAVLLEDMAANLFTPILRALAEAQESLTAEYGSPAFKLLSGEAVPKSLLPPKNELLVEDVDTFPKTYIELMNRTAKTESAALVQAFCGEIGDPVLRANLPEKYRPWSTTQMWQPNLSKFQPGNATVASRMRPSFAFDLRKVDSRSMAWLTVDKSTSPGDFIAETLKDYLHGGSPEENKRRAQRFALLLSQAFTAAHPFVELNKAWLSSRFNYSVDYNFLISGGIPISSTDDPVTYEIVDGAVAKHLRNPQTRELAYDSAHLGDIDIIAMLDPFSPSGALSLADPIAAAYAETRLSAAAGSDDSGGSNFWHGRRARPLLESIPLTPSTRLALTRGWITARLLGFVTITKVGDTSTASITDGKETCSLLNPTLGDPQTAWDWFGMTLESALLAEMLASKGDNQAFNALHLLLRLGSSSGSERVSASYNTVNPILASASVVEFGRFSSKGAEPPTDLAGAITGLLTSVTDVEMPPTPGFARVSYVKQLAPLIAEACRQMLAAIKFGESNDDPEDEVG